VISISDKSNANDHSVDSVVSISSTIVSKCNETQPAITNILPVASSTASVSSVTTMAVEPLIQSTPPITFGLQPSKNKSKADDKNANKTPQQFSFGSPIVSVAESSVESNKRQINEVDGKTIGNLTPEPTNVTFTFKTPTTTTTKNIVNNSEDQHKLFQSPEMKENITNDKSQIDEQNDSKRDKSEQSLQLTKPASKSNEPAINLSTFSDVSKKNDNNLPILQFSGQVENSKQPTFTFGVPKADEKQSTPLMQFGSTKVDNKQSTPVMQFGSTKVDNKQSTPVMQFGSIKVDNKQSTPVMQFGAPKVDDKQSTPVIQFDVPKANDKESTPVMQFGTPKVDKKKSPPVMKFSESKADDKHATPVMPFNVSNVNDKQSVPIMQFGSPKIDGQQSTPSLFGTTKESDNKTSTQSLFSFGNNQKANEKSTEPVKFQFGSSEPNNVSVASTTESNKNGVFGSNSLQNPNPFGFGKTDNVASPTGDPPKYDAAIEKSTPKLQFGALPTSPFGTSNVDQSSKPQFSTSVSQPIDNQGPKLVFGSQTSENKPTTSASNLLFTNNLPNSVFQFNSTNSKADVVTSSSFSFSSTKTTPIFGASALQNFGDKPTYQFNSQKTEDQKTQFSTPSFGPQSTTTSAPFKFGGIDKPASFSSAFPTTNQTLQFTNNTEKAIEPFKFGSTVPSNNTFQFSSNKTDNKVKFGQTSNTFSSTPGFSGFGNSAPQQVTSTFVSVSPPQHMPFNNITSTSAPPTFRGVASPTSNSFGTNQGFQFGGSNNAPSSSSTFAFGGNSQPTKPEGAFNFSAIPTTTAVSLFQFGQTSSSVSTPQFGAPPAQGI